MHNMPCPYSGMKYLLQGIPSFFAYFSVRAFLFFIHESCLLYFRDFPWPLALLEDKNISLECPTLYWEKVGKRVSVVLQILTYLHLKQCFPGFLFFQPFFPFFFVFH